MTNNDEFKNARFLSVSALNRYLSYKFDMDIHLQNVYLEGEISNFKVSGKNVYFSIKDEFSEITAMMFYPTTKTINFDVTDGMLVQVIGKVGVYEKRGTYSIICKKMIKAGIGALYQDFLDLKEKLQKEGLFDQKYKKALPEFPKKIAVITSPTGEAINDIVSTINKRYPLVEILLYPALVQGEDVIPVGNIVVNNIIVTENNNIKSFEVSQNIYITAGEGNAEDWLGPGLDAVPVNLTGKMDAANLYCSIDIDMSETLGQTINVVFGEEAKVTSIENIVAENGAKVIYDITGREVKEITNAGIYIVNGKKVFVK
mgnify:CR=1 FL=1